MVIKNGRSPARRKSASSSAKSSRSNTVSKSGVHSQHVAPTDQLDGVVNIAEAATVESEAGDRILEKTRADDGASGNGLPAESVELESWNPAEFGELHHVAEADGQLNLLDWADKEPPEPDDYESIELFDQAYKQWFVSQQLTVNSQQSTPDNCHAMIKTDNCQVIESCQLTENQKLQQSIGNFTSKDLVVKKSVKLSELEDNQSGIFLQVTDTICDKKSNSHSLSTKENATLPTTTDTTGLQKGNEISFCTELSGNNIEAQSQPDIKSIISMEINQTIASQILNVSELQNTKNFTLSKMEFGMQEESKDLIRERSTNLFQMQQEKLELTTQQFCEQLKTTESQQEPSGSISKCEFLQDAAELAQDLNLQALSLEDLSSVNSLNGTNTVNQFSNLDIPEFQFTEISEALKEYQDTTTSAAFLPPAPHSQLMESDLLAETIATVSPMSLEQSETCSQNLPSSKTSPACSTVPIPPATNQEATSATSSTPYRQVGTMRNGSVSAQTSLPLRGVAKGYLLLRSPGALSSTGKASPPGKTRLEHQLLELGLISAQEVVAPEFLEAGYQLPIGFTNLQENRTALELAQQQPIDHKSESLQEMAITAIDVQPLVMHSTGESPLLDSNELNISIALPSNMGALTKAELISMAQEQHQLICVIERKQSELALEKLHRVYVTGICLMEFKKKCRYGEFIEQVEACGIGERSAQGYMTVAKNWEVIEAKAKLVALLGENNEAPNLGVKWALETVRYEKKQLKSAAPPKDPDSWRTPNTREQPIVDLVRQALGGNIWCDPCSDSSAKVPASVRYFKDDDGLAEHQTWSRTVFINPPFSDPSPWVEKCCLNVARGNVSAAIMLLKAGTVSNVGTGEMINKYASAICHWRGRINFLNDEGNAVKGSDFDCVFVYFGARLDLFRQAFQQRGTIATIDNHYSSVNKKFLDALPEPQTLKSEQKQLAAAVGLSNGRSLLPDTRDRDRDAMERHDPNTVFDTMPTVFNSAAQPEIASEIESISADFQQAKSDCLNDYITAISSNLSAFSDEQVAFLAKIINEESAKRIGF